MLRVDWERTKRNINDRLCDLAYKKQLAEYMCMGEQAVQRMLNEGHDRIISVEELANIARFLECEVNDLVIYESDKYIEPQFVIERIEPELKKTEEVKTYANMVARMKNNEEICDLYEFLLYLPLMKPWSLGSFIDKSRDNLNINKAYIKMKLNDLYKEIPQIPEKDYADWYRDSVLRVKGEPYTKERVVEDDCDLAKKEKYKEKVLEFAEFCKHYYGLKMNLKDIKFDI